MHRLVVPSLALVTAACSPAAAPESPTPASPETAAPTAMAEAPAPSGTARPVADPGPYTGALTEETVSGMLKTIYGEVDAAIVAGDGKTFPDRVAKVWSTGQAAVMIDGEFFLDILSARLDTTREDLDHFLRDLENRGAHEELKATFLQRNELWDRFEAHATSGNLPKATKESCVMVKKRQLELMAKVPSDVKKAVSKPVIFDVMLPLRVAEQTLNGCKKHGFACIADAPSEAAIAACK